MKSPGKGVVQRWIIRCWAEHFFADSMIDRKGFEWVLGRSLATEFTDYQKLLLALDDARRQGFRARIEYVGKDPQGIQRNLDRCLLSSDVREWLESTQTPETLQSPNLRKVMSVLISPNLFLSDHEIGFIRGEVRRLDFKHRRPQAKDINGLAIMEAIQKLIYGGSPWVTVEDVVMVLPPLKHFPFKVVQAKCWQLQKRGFLKGADWNKDVRFEMRLTDNGRIKLAGEKMLVPGVLPSLMEVDRDDPTFPSAEMGDDLKVLPVMDKTSLHGAIHLSTVGVLEDLAKEFESRQKERTAFRDHVAVEAKMNEYEGQALGFKTAVELVRKELRRVEKELVGNVDARAINLQEKLEAFGVSKDQHNTSWLTCNGLPVLNLDVAFKRAIENQFHYGAIQMGRRWYAKRFIPEPEGNGTVEFWDDGEWKPYSISELQERKRKEPQGLPTIGDVAEIARRMGLDLTSAQLQFVEQALQPPQVVSTEQEAGIDIAFGHATSSHGSVKPQTPQWAKYSSACAIRAHDRCDGKAKYGDGPCVCSCHEDESGGEESTQVERTADASESPGWNPMPGDTQDSVPVYLGHDQIGHATVKVVDPMRGEFEVLEIKYLDDWGKRVGEIFPVSRIVQHVASFEVVAGRGLTKVQYLYPPIGGPGIHPLDGPRLVEPKFPSNEIPGEQVGLYQMLISHYEDMHTDIAANARAALKHWRGQWGDYIELSPDVCPWPWIQLQPTRARQVMMFIDLLEWAMGWERVVLAVECDRPPDVCELAVEAFIDRDVKGFAEQFIEVATQEASKFLHYPRVAPVPGGEWRAKCPCGWTGEVRQAKRTAENDCVRHRPPEQMA